MALPLDFVSLDPRGQTAKRLMPKGLILLELSAYKNTSVPPRLLDYFPGGSCRKGKGG